MMTTTTNKINRVCGALTIVGKVRADEVAAIADRLEPRVQKRFLDLMQYVRRHVKLSDLSNALATGDLAKAETLLTRNLSMNLAVMVTLLRDAFVQAGEITVQKLPPKLNAGGLNFSSVSPAVTNFINSYSLGLVSGLSTTTRDAIRVILRDANLYGGHPRTQAAQIRNMLGLTPLQAQSIARLTRTLQESGLPPGRVAQLISKRSERLIKDRALNIARTETMRMLNEGKQAAWNQLVESGILPQGTLKKWIVAHDDRLCPICTTLDEAVIGVQSSFTTTVEFSATRAQQFTTSVPPIHPRCRCTVGLYFKGQL